MTDLFKLILGILASRFKARATLEAENLILRQQVNVLRRRTPKLPHLNNTDRFYLFGCIGGFRPSLRWLRLSGRRPSFAGTVLCAITPPPNSFESVYGLCSVRTMTFTIHASKNGQSVVTVRISPVVAVDKARVLERGLAARLMIARAFVSGS